ncbi:MAG: AAA family ATPase [Sandaracinus sp.]|nr:AAA family ATPase [Sandaracinus sp.]
MKTRILRIHVRNLASLAGDHVVDLEHGALADAGIFPIVGPTGAGKSTLLDGICLALFKQLPRLPNSGSKGDDGLTPADPRHAVRRGAGEGFAQVDFVGRDGRRYRATWQARRARSRADGAWQAASHTLQDLQTQKLLGDGKKETAALIEQRLGLGYDELVRSMLLPQGEFARLLHAKADERTKLLEKLTRTTIYARLSERAAARRGEARRAVEELDARLGEVRALSHEERASLDTEIADLERVAVELRTLAEASAKAERLWQEIQRREAEVREAEDGARRAEESVVALAPLREALERAERCLPAALPLEALRVATKLVAEAKARQLHAAEEHTRAQDEHETASRRRNEAISTRRDAESALGLREPELEAATKLDRALRDAELDRGHAHEAAQRAEKARGDKDRELGQRADEHRTTRAEREALTAALEADVAGLELAASWPSLRGELVAWCALADECVAHAKQVEEGERQLQLVTADIERAAQARGSLEARVALTRTALDESQRRIEACVRSGRTRESEERLRERQNALRQLRDAERELSTATERHEIHARAVAEAALALESHRSKTENAKADQEHADEQLRVAEEQLERGRRANLAASLRTALRSGEACPVCGSCEHPGAPVGVKSSDLEHAWNEARVALERAAECLRISEREQAALEARSEAAALAERDASSTLEQRSARAEHLRAADALLETDRLDGAAQHALADVARQLETIAAEREAIDRAREEHDTRTKSHQKAVDARAAADVRVNELEQRAAQLRGSLDAQRAILHRLESDEASRRQTLTRATGSAPTRTTERELSERVETRRAKQEQQRQLDARAQNLESQLELLRQEHAKRRDDEAKAYARLAQATTAVDTLRHQRNAVLDGRSVAQVEKELRDAIEVARRAETVAEASYGATTARVHESRRSLASRTDDARERARELEAAEGRVNEIVTQVGLPRERVDETVAEWPQARVQAEREKLAEFERTSTEARAVLGRAREALSEITRAAEVGSLDELKSVARRRPYCDDAVAKANEELASRRSQRRRDDELRERQAALLAQREQAAARVDLFERLVMVIGSGQGASNHLSRFAQGMALEILVEAANLQLGRLAPRFRLQRVADLDLELVDRDLADEARPVHGLSGGETFLVSLALALGLASLAGDELDLGSLFVDEGFGSLDPETLETALAALEAIHADGVQVAIISHVEGLAERFSASVVVRRVAPGRSVVEVRS